MKKTNLKNAPSLSGNLSKDILENIAQTFKTPLYVYDFDRIERL